MGLGRITVLCDVLAFIFLFLKNAVQLFNLPFRLENLFDCLDMDLVMVPSGELHISSVDYRLDMNLVMLATG